MDPNSLFTISETLISLKVCFGTLIFELRMASEREIELVLSYRDNIDSVINLCNEIKIYFKDFLGEFEIPNYSSLQEKAYEYLKDILDFMEKQLEMIKKIRLMIPSLSIESRQNIIDITKKIFQLSSLFVDFETDVADFIKELDRTLRLEDFESVQKIINDLLKLLDNINPIVKY